MAIKLNLDIVQTGKKAPKFKLLNDLTGRETLQELLENTRQVHISVAKTILKEEQGKGFDKDPRVRVDNKFEREEESVKFFGKIEYFAKRSVTEAIVDIFEELDKRSPVDTGKYSKSNVLFYNNLPVAHSPGEARAWLVTQEKSGSFKNSDTFRFINTSPYARRLEYKGVRRGTTGRNKGKNFAKRGRTVRKRDSQVLLRPQGAYYLTHRLARRKHKAIANLISFKFIPNGGNGINIIPRAGERTAFKDDGRPYLYPTIVIKLAGEGIK